MAGNIRRGKLNVQSSRETAVSTAPEYTSRYIKEDAARNALYENVPFDWHLGRLQNTTMTNMRDTTDNGEAS